MLLSCGSEQQRIPQAPIAENSIFQFSEYTVYLSTNKTSDLSKNIAKKYNIDLNNQKARQFNTNDFNDFDKIYVMDNDNYSKIISLAKNQSEINKVELILNEIFPKEFQSVPDPYYGGKDGFQNIYDLLNSACDKIIEKYEIR